MKLNYFYNLWPTIEGKDVRIVHGYQKQHITYCKLVEMNKFPNEVYLKSDGGLCLTVRPIKSITLV